MWRTWVSCSNEDDLSWVGSPSCPWEGWQVPGCRWWTIVNSMCPTDGHLNLVHNIDTLMSPICPFVLVEAAPDLGLVEGNVSRLGICMIQWPALQKRFSQGKLMQAAAPSSILSGSEEGLSRSKGLAGVKSIRPSWNWGLVTDFLILFKVAVMGLAHHNLPFPPQLSFFHGTLELVEECCNQIPERFLKSVVQEKSLETITTSTFRVIQFEWINVLRVPMWW